VAGAEKGVSMRILIVDDDGAVRNLYARWLGDAGFDLACFGSGTGAVEAATRSFSDDAPFAVAFVDTDGAGAETARRLRLLDPDLNLVVVTAGPSFAPAVVGGPIDKQFHIAKPVAAAEIVQMATALRERWAIDRGLITARAQLRAQVILLEERRRDLAEAEKRAVHSATHDSLTEAPNRLAFLRALEARVRRPGRFAVGMVDLDRFKLVNDTLGHLAGDALIRAMCAILHAEAPFGALVARLGGDEFGLLFDTSGERAGVAACTRIVAACAVPVAVIGTTVQGGASAGVMVAEGGGGGEAIELVRRADLALNEAKRRGRGGVQLFDESMDEELRYRHRIEGELALVLQRGELALAFQPIVDRDDLSLEGFEALLRWNHPTCGILAPAGFLAVAEESNLIHALGDWVLGEALAEAARWQRPYVAVNVSPRQFRRHDFARQVAGHLARAGVSASRLQIEVSERALADDPDRAATTLKELRSLGCRVLLDDFGAGPCNIGELRRLPIDAVKIDRSYVHAIGRERGAAGLLHALVHLGRSLGLEVVAKGVETAAQLQALRIAGASQVQGFIVAQPLSPDAAWAMASAGPGDVRRTGTDG
jgi:diguanylate cyclase (GGDEF)-like protein